MDKVREWDELAAQFSIDGIRASTAAGSGHPTSSMSAAHLLAVLFAGHLRYDVSDPKSPANDRFVLSKGHASPLMFSVLRAIGAIDDGELMSYRKFGSPLQGHPVPLPDMPWIDVATGSLGQGLPMALGMALAMKLDGNPARVFHHQPLGGDAGLEARGHSMPLGGAPGDAETHPGRAGAAQYGAADGLPAQGERGGYFQRPGVGLDFQPGRQPAGTFHPLELPAPVFHAHAPQASGLAVIQQLVGESRQQRRAVIGLPEAGDAPARRLADFQAVGGGGDDQLITLPFPGNRLGVINCLRKRKVRFCQRFHPSHQLVDGLYGLVQHGYLLALYGGVRRGAGDEVVVVGGG